MCPSFPSPLHLQDVPPGGGGRAAVPLLAGEEVRPADGEEAAVCVGRLRPGPRPPGGALHGRQQTHGKQELQGWRPTAAVVQPFSLSTQPVVVFDGVSSGPSPAAAPGRAGVRDGRADGAGPRLHPPSGAGGGAPRHLLLRRPVGRPGRGREDGHRRHQSDTPSLHRYGPSSQ